jgi:membrane-bound ClpP family serine protease
MDRFVVTQILGIISLVLFVISLQQRKKENFLLLQTAGTLLYIAQFILTGRLTGVLTFSVVAVRGLVFFVYRKKGLKPSVAVLVVFLLALLVSTVYSWQNPLSLIPFVATAAKTWATWQDDMKRTRRVSLFCQSIMIECCDVIHSNLR